MQLIVTPPTYLIVTLVSALLGHPQPHEGGFATNLTTAVSMWVGG